MNLDNII